MKVIKVFPSEKFDHGGNLKLSDVVLLSPDSCMYRQYRSTIVYPCSHGSSRNTDSSSLLLSCLQ